MQKLLLPCSLILAVVFAGKAGSNEPECEFGIEAAKRASRAFLGFAGKIYRQVVYNTTRENTVFSPVSITLALALLEAGASGDTQKELQAHLGAPAANEPDSSTMYQSLQRHLQIRSEQTSLSIANGLFHQDGLSLKSDYLSKMRQCFDTEIQKAPFRSNPEEARRRVNRWVSNSTGEKIPELFKPDTLSPDVVAVLANAIHMKAAWAVPFSQSENLPFYRYGQSQQAQTVSFMVHQGEYTYHEDDRLQWVEIPYEGGLSMHIVLPKQRDAVQSIEEEVILGAQQTSAKSNSGLERREVILKIPKFRVRSTVDLGNILQQVGLGKIFTDEADFSRMAADKLKVSKAVHEAYIKVNENGTEAAAATGVSMINVSAIISPPEPPITFTADHPFVYLILHNPTGAILFSGKINRIDENSEN